jgi:hypothetical protein
MGLGAKASQQTHGESARKDTNLRRRLSLPKRASAELAKEERRKR